MPNLPISQLPELLSSTITANAEFAVAQGGTTYRVKQGSLNPYSQVYGLFSQTRNSVLDITIQFSSNDPLNYIYSDLFVFNKIF